ncbi:DUF5691 domain-containing protein [Actinomadura atramentaria]|uniref:DUF5691 domain-containing protein n=1 Tax=Actinomadura atramentaria TaxID=1990 RepID=UPI0003656044|nr:DUF5691 domain-containing protein [Actinomadura atramentaria]
MSAWEEHVGAALLGTARRPPPALPDAPDAGSDAAARLLDQAALLTVRRRAGLRPARGGADPVAPAPPEDLPPVPPAAAARLDRVLAGEGDGCLAEWLGLAADRGLRVPARVVPDLLEQGRGKDGWHLRAPIAAVAGRRGVWLALQNPRWAWLIASAADPGTDDPAVWTGGTAEQRVAYLARLRRADPAAARAALLDVWDRDRAVHRPEFLTPFGAGLSAADEEFLELALDDRTGSVRLAAANLLARLPESAYAARMAARARACVRAERRTVRRRAQTWLHVEPPAEHDEGMARDGVPFHPEGSFAPGRTPAPPRAWLREIVARTPPATWTGAFGLPPAEILALPVTDGAAAGRGADDLHLGLARAALRFHDAGWARALLTAGVLLDEPRVLGELVHELPAAERDDAAAGLVRWVDDARALTDGLLRTLPRPWSGALAATMTAKVAALLERPAGTANTALQALCASAAHGFDPALADRAADRFAEVPAAETAAARDRLAATLRFRHDMLKEFPP